MGPVRPPVWPVRAVDRATPLPPIDWQTAYQVDFRTLATDPDPGDWSNGAVTIDGIGWTAANSANADTFRLLNGTGIQIASKQNTAYSATSKTAPVLEVDIADLVADYAWEDRILVQLLVDEATLDENDQGYGCTVGSGSHSDSDFCVGIEVRSDGTNDEVRSQRFTATVTQSNDVTLAEPRVIAASWRTFAGATWTHADPIWPRPGDMTEASKLFSAANFGPFAGDSWWAPASDVLRIYAKRPDTSTSDFTAVFVGLRVLRQLA